MVTLFLTSISRQFNMERTIFSTNGIGTIGYPQIKKLDSYLKLYIKINSKWTNKLKLSAKTIKLLEKNTGVNVQFSSVQLLSRVPLFATP